jgi:hypothetical protein
MPSVPINFDNCFEDSITVPLEKIPLHIPLVNVMSSADDLRIASVKASEINEMIREQEQKFNQNFYDIVTSKWSIMGTLTLFFVSILCSCCCCKCCRNCAFWLWDKWNPADCWQQTRERCCVNINNYNCPEVAYSKSDKPSPALLMRSLPEIENAIADKELGSMTKEKLEHIALRTRSKTSFR